MAVISLTVVKWSDATYVEDQDQWWHGGITRSVFLYATGPVHLADVRAIPTLAEDLASGSLEVRVEVAFAGVAPEPGWTVEAEVPGLTGLLVAAVPHTGRHEGPREQRDPGVRKRFADARQRGGRHHRVSQPVRRPDQQRRLRIAEMHGDSAFS